MSELVYLVAAIVGTLTPILGVMARQLIRLSKALDAIPELRARVRQPRRRTVSLSVNSDLTVAIVFETG